MTLSEQAYQAIKADIIRGVLDPEQHLTQAAMVERYNYGLAAIRAALKQLANENFIRAIPRYGYLITPITISDVQEIFELRLPLEATAARLAAERAPEETINEILEAASHTYVYQDLQSYAKFLTYNSAFHLSIAQATGNQRLVQILSKLLDESNQIFYMALDLADTAEETLDEHSDLARALQQRDPDLAEKLAREQVIRSADYVLAGLMRTRNAITKKTIGRFSV